MQDVLFTLLAGMAATLIMSLFMHLIHGSGLANADMIRALGSMITRKFENALAPGIAVHLIGGCIFAFPYALILSAAPAGNFGAEIGVGALIGFFHGFVFSFVLIAVVAESHPLEQFRSAGRSVAVAHIAGHAVYGAVMGLLVTSLGIDFGIRLAAD